MVNSAPIQTKAVPAKGRSWAWPSLLLILIVGTVLRFHLLGFKSLWLDEVTTVGFAQMPWRDYLRTMWWGDANMVFYYTLLRGWQHLGDSEFYLRTFSALFGIAAIAAIYAFSNRFLSRKAGIFAACLLAVHSFHIQYSQEVRSYSFLTLLLILCAYAFLAAIETPERTSLWVWYALLSTLAIYTQVFAVFVLASQWLILAPHRIKRLGIPRLLATAAVIGILSIPVAYVIGFHGKDQVATWSEFYHSPGLHELRDVLQRIVGAKAGDVPTSWLGVILLGLYAGAWVTAIRSAFRTSPDRAAEPVTNPSVALLACWLIFPFVAMFCFSFLEPIFYPRYLLMCVPAAVLLAAHGLVQTERLLSQGRTRAFAAFALMAGLSLYSTWTFYGSFKNYGNDWRGVTRYLLSRQEPQDAILFYTFTGHREFEYYVHRERETGAKIVTPAILFPISLDAAAIEKRTQPYRRIWFVQHITIENPATEKKWELIRSALAPHFNLSAETKFEGTGATAGETGRITVALYSEAGPADK
jgi:mannosyltransferase